MNSGAKQSPTGESSVSDDPVGEGIESHNDGEYR